MLTKSDKQLMNRLMEENADFHYIITKLQEEHHFTVSRISHEIGNPLTTIYSSMQLIGDSHPEVRKFKYWSHTIDDIKFLKRLLHDLSAYNKAAKSVQEQLDLSSLLRECEDSFRSSAEETGKKIEFIYDTFSPIFVNGNKVGLRQVLNNLIYNALDAVSEGGLVQVRLYFGQNSEPVLEVKDNGCGIAKDQLPHIFEPFVTFKENGTGLGLAITERIVSEHGAKPEVFSVLNEGTVFRVGFPVQ